MKRLALISLLTFGLSVVAEVYEQRQENQENRIQQGIEKGTLNRGEAARAAAGQERIENAEARAERDGRVTNQEKAKLDRLQDRESRQIKRMKHNRRR